MARRFGRVLVVVCGLLPYGPAAAQGIVVACGEVTGEWAWRPGGTVHFDSDGSATWSPAPGSGASLDASWHCDTADGSILVEWPQGLTDRLQLSADGQRMSGTNQTGVGI